jgi:hypothetical protein
MMTVKSLTSMGVTSCFLLHADVQQQEKGHKGHTITALTYTVVVMVVVGRQTPHKGISGAKGNILPETFYLGDFKGHVCSEGPLSRALSSASR